MGGQRPGTHCGPSWGQGALAEPAHLAATRAPAAGDRPAGRGADRWAPRRLPPQPPSSAPGLRWGSGRTQAPRRLRSHEGRTPGAFAGNLTPQRVPRLPHLFHPPPPQEVGDEPQKGSGGRGFDLSQTLGLQFWVKGPRSPPEAFPSPGRWGGDAGAPRYHLRLMCPGQETCPGLGGLEDCLVVERWGQLNLHPHPPCCVDSLTPLHPHSRVPFCGGEGIILILQNAQQLIKSRRPRLWGSFACEWGW